MLDCRKEINLMCEALGKGQKWRDKIDDVQNDETRQNHLALFKVKKRSNENRPLGPHHLEIKENRKIQRRR